MTALQDAATNFVTALGKIFENADPAHLAELDAHVATLDQQAAAAAANEKTNADDIADVKAALLIITSGLTKTATGSSDTGTGGSSASTGSGDSTTAAASAS